jgi:hypothetical protein
VLPNLSRLYPEPAKVAVNTIDVPLPLLRAIAPTRQELPLLAHVRQVNTGGKELLGLDLDGWFSLVLANRLPAIGLNTAHLVSFEGWTDRLQTETGQASPMPAGATTVRLITLANWSFTSSAERGSFGEIVRAIDSDLLKMKPQATSADVSFTAVSEALDVGYTPLAYDMRSGERSLGWYRGPLTPVNVERVDRLPFESAEAGLIYDPGTGIFDTSYAVGWQIGRLVALADASFGRSLARWRQRVQRFRERLLELDAISLRLAEQSTLGTLDEIFEKTRIQPGMSEDAARQAIETRRVLLREFIRMLDNPRAASAIAASALLKAGPAALENTKPSSTGKHRLSKGAPVLSPEELAELDHTPPGQERMRKLHELIKSAVEGPVPA